MLNYMLLAVVVNVKCVAVRRQDLCGMLRPSTYDDDAVCVCVNTPTAVEINVLNYNVAVRQLHSQSASYSIVWPRCSRAR